MIWWFLYCIVVGMFFKHNDQMGGWFIGLIVALTWPVVVLLWIIGSVLEKYNGWNERKYYE